MLASISRIIARRRVRHLLRNQSKRFISWQDVQRVAVIIDDSVGLSKNELDKFIGSLDKYCDVFYLELGRKTSSFGDWICLTRKDRDIFKLPKKHLSGTLKNRRYDLVLNVSEKYPGFSSILSAEAKASFACGKTNNYGETDLIISRKAGQSLSEYLQEVRRYLQMIRPRPLN